MVSVRPRKFTFKRLVAGPLPKENEGILALYRPQWAEVEEFVAQHGKNSLIICFYELDYHGNPSLIRLIDNVVDIDRGVSEF